MSTATLSEQRTKKRNEVVEAIHDLLRDKYERGVEPDADTILALADSAGLTDGELQTMDDIAAKRATWKTQRGQHDKAWAEIQRIEREVENALAKLRKAESTYRETVGPLEALRQDAQQRLDAATAAESELLHTCRSPVLLAQREVLRQQHSELTRQIADASDWAERCRAGAKDETPGPGGVPVSSHYAAEFEAAERQLAGLQQQLRDVDDGLSEIVDQMREY